MPRHSSHWCEFKQLWSHGRYYERKVVVPPVPRPFDFGFTARRPLVPLAAVMMFLNQSARQVTALIEDGQLRWAFDIRSAAAAQREVRVLRQSLFEFTGLFVPRNIPRGGEAAEFAEIMGLVLPPGAVVTPKMAASGPGQRARERAARRLQIKMRLPPAAFRQLLFPKEPLLVGTEVAQCFSCNGQHVLNLLKEKSLQAVNLRRGQKASPLVTRSSVVEFLRQRRIS